MDSRFGTADAALGRVRPNSPATAKSRDSRIHCRLSRACRGVLQSDRLFSYGGVVNSTRKRFDLLLLAVKDGFKFGNQVFQTLLSFSHRLLIARAFVRQVIYGFAISPRANAI